MSLILLTLALCVLLVGVAVVLLGVRVLFVRGGRFPSPHAHDNPALRSRGVGCHLDRE